MAKVDKAIRRTVIVLPDDPDQNAGISSYARKVHRKMEGFVQAGVAEEVESSVEGAREWEFARDMVRLPVHRTPREWTDEQKEEARERLQGVRDAVKSAKELASKKLKKTAAAPTPVAKKTFTKKAKAVEPEPEDEDEEEVEEEADPDEDEDEGDGDSDEEDEDEGEEVVVNQRKVTPPPPAKPKGKSKFAGK